MRELLRALYDRLGEVSFGYRDSQADKDLLRLRGEVGSVLSKGYFDASFTDLDMRQLPPVL